MKMRDAFKALLDGEKITRPNWDGGYLTYDKNNNSFVINLGDAKTLIPIRFVSFEKDKIGFSILPENHLFMEILDDDKNEIWITSQELIDEDAMRWRLIRYCQGKSCNVESCKLYNPEERCVACSIRGLRDKSPEELRRLYNIIKEEK